MNSVWVEDPPPQREVALQKLYDYADPVGKTYTIVSLEGPPDVAEVAEGIFRQIRHEVHLLLSLLDQREGGGSLYEAHEALYRATVAARPVTERTFIQAARLVLGGNLAEPE